MAPEFLYHGSPTFIEGAINQNKAICLSESTSNVQTGVYATDIRDFAIIMAILKSKGVRGSSLDFYCPEGGLNKGIIYEGWPQQRQVYVYTLSSVNFKQVSDRPESRQWVHYGAVKPVHCEILEIKDFMHLIRKGTSEESAKRFKLLSDRLGRDTHL